MVDSKILLLASTNLTWKLLQSFQVCKMGGGGNCGGAEPPLAEKWGGGGGGGASPPPQPPLIRMWSNEATAKLRILLSSQISEHLPVLLGERNSLGRIKGIIYLSLLLKIIISYSWGKTKVGGLNILYNNNEQSVADPKKIEEVTYICSHIHSTLYQLS